MTLEETNKDRGPIVITETVVKKVGIGPSWKDRWQDFMEKISGNKEKNLNQIIDFARSRGSVTNEEVQNLLRVSDGTASRYLADLVKTGRLRKFGANSLSVAYEIVD